MGDSDPGTGSSAGLTPDVHVVLSSTPGATGCCMRSARRLTAAFTARGLIEAYDHRDAHALRDDDPGVVHFGYRDGSASRGSPTASATSRLTCSSGDAGRRSAARL